MSTEEIVEIETGPGEPMGSRSFQSYGRRQSLACVSFFRTHRCDP